MRDTAHNVSNSKRYQCSASRAIQAQLVAQSSSFRQFALERGYKPRTVTQVVARWADKEEMPRGHLSLCILRDLSRVIGQEIVPGILGPTDTLEKPTHTLEQKEATPLPSADVKPRSVKTNPVKANQGKANTVKT